MQISEIYRSNQGEGLLTGTPSVFVRTSGCNLRCRFCDTPYASWNPQGEPMNVSDIVQNVQQAAGGAKHVVVTGGEPMLPLEISELTNELHAAGFHITIETAGTVDRQVHCDLMSISPKLSNSDPSLERAGGWRERHRATRLRPKIVDQLIRQFNYQLKFVVDLPADLDEIELFLNELSTVAVDRVLLMPEGVEQSNLESRESWLEPLCRQRGYRLCRRMHILWYGNRRGT